MIYDYVITKPELNEDTLAHYGIKGMKWKKRLKNIYYKGKNKVGNRITRINRYINGYGTMDISDKRGTEFKKSGTVHVYDALGKDPKTISSMIYKKGKIYGGTANSQTSQEGSRVEAGIAAGRKRAGIKNDRPSSRKKKVISGTTSVKKRGVAR